MNSKSKLSAEVMDLLRHAYDIVSKVEKEEISKLIEKEVYLKITYSEILREKKEYGFKSIEEHVKLMLDEKERLKNTYEKHKRRKGNFHVFTSKNRSKIVSFISTAAAVIAILLLLFQPNIINGPSDKYVAKTQYDSVNQEAKSLASLLEEKAVLLKNISSYKQKLTSLEETLNFQIRKQIILENNPSAIDELALYKKLAERKGYIDKDGLFSLPDTSGVYAGYEDELEVTLKSPSKMNAYFIDDLLMFSWTTTLTNNAKLGCYLVKGKEKVLEQVISLKDGSISLDVAMLKPGVYFWLINTAGRFSKRHYFVLLP